MSERMWGSRFTLVLYSAAVAGWLVSVPCGSSDAEWSYGDVDSWPGDCLDHFHQSPIDIDPLHAEYDPSLTRLILHGYYRRMQPHLSLSVTNTGHSVKFSVPDEADILVRGAGLPSEYKLAQFHFHWGARDSRGSEHRLAGVRYPLEMHLVHWDHLNYPDSSTASLHPDGLAVVAVLFEISDVERQTEDMERVAEDAESVPDSGDETDGVPSFALRRLLPLSTEYLRYRGSLTTPPCSESVIWTLLVNPVKVSREEMRSFRAHYDSNHNWLVDNFRPVQPLNDRNVTRSFKF